MTILPTDRQRQVLLMRANGMRNAEIAAELKIRRDTVSAILTRYCRKVGAEHTDHAIAIGLAVGDIGIHQIIIPRTTVRNSNMEPTL